MKKLIFSAVGLTLVPIIGFLISKARSKQSKPKPRLYVGIELGGTNYNVAIAESVHNNNGDILDFRVLKRKNGNTYQNP